MVNEKVYKFVDREAKMTAFYDKEGNLVSSRPATRDELLAMYTQLTVISRLCSLLSLCF